MIRIQLNDEWLDTYAKEEIQLSWTAFRFQKELRSGYTNDLALPKTARNLRLLGTVGLLDSQTQLFGTKTVRCIVQVGLVMTDMMLQVSAVTDTEIRVCLYEICFPEFFKGKSINDMLIDNSSTIWPWKPSSTTDYPDVFLKYNYGMPYDAEKAQYHPVKPLRDILYTTQGNYTMPLPPQNWMLMATKKTVCPYNRVQVIEFNDTAMDGDDFKLHGGQHITNDLSMDENTVVTFNRNHVFCSIKLWVCWRKKWNTTQNKTMFFNINGQHNWWINIPSGSTDTGCEVITLSPTQNYEFSEGDTIGFSFPDVNRYEYVSVIAKIEYTAGGWYNYITKDDFGIELEYVGRDPSLRVAGTIDAFLPMDGYNHAVHHKNGSLTQFSTENLSFAYFGYYCNLPEMKICDVWHSLQWLTGNKLSFDHQRLVTYESPNESDEIQGIITEIRPKSDKIGQKNYIKFKGEDASPVCTIPNEWLSESVTLHESIFMNAQVPDFDRIRLMQYSNPEYNETWRWWSCDFDEVDGLVLAEKDQYGVLQPIELNTFGFEELNQTMEVSVTTFSPFLRTKDIIWIDGRRYLVVSGKTSMDIQKSELVCFLFPKTVREMNTLSSHNNQNE